MAASWCPAIRQYSISREGRRNSGAEYGVADILGVLLGGAFSEVDSPKVLKLTLLAESHELLDCSSLRSAILKILIAGSSNKA